MEEGITRQLPQAKQGHTWFDFDWYWYNIYYIYNHSRDCQNSQNALPNLISDLTFSTFTANKWFGQLWNFQHWILKNIVIWLPLNITFTQSRRTAKFPKEPLFGCTYGQKDPNRKKRRKRGSKSYTSTWRRGLFWLWLLEYVVNYSMLPKTAAIPPPHKAPKHIALEMAAQQSAA